MREGASAVGRTLPDTFHTTALSYACVLRPGESMTSDRVIDEIGPMAAACTTGGSSIRWTATPARWPAAAATCGRNIAFTEKMETPPGKRYQRVHPAIALPAAGGAPLHHRGS